MKDVERPPWAKGNMEDHKAKKNTFERGLSYQEATGAQPARVVDAIPRGSTDTLYSPGIPQNNGVPMLGTFDDPVEEKPRCHAMTKAESPCRAHPVKGELFCAGHMRAMGGVPNRSE